MARCIRVLKETVMFPERVVEATSSLAMVAGVLGATRVPTE